MKKNAFTLFILVLCAFTLPAFGYDTHYAMIVDAGSSGSRLHLFEYEMNNGIPKIEDIFSENTKPGLSSYATQPSAAGLSLKKLLEDATVELNKRHVALPTVSISVFATAGMRLLPAPEQRQIYASVSDYITSHTQFKVAGIGTISGKMEGLFGWLDINYLAQNFQNHSATVGSIDMGGASTQIVFETTDTSKPQDEITVTVGDKSYLVFSKSLLGLGQDQALASMLTHADASSCYPQGYSSSKVMQGNFNYASCSSIYQDVINNKQVNQQILNTASNHFIAFSGAYYDLNFLNVDKTPDYATVTDHLLTVCSQTWQQLSNEHPNDKYLSNYCANNVYLSNLLFQTYQMGANQLTVEKQINQHDIDWTLGALLYAIINAKH
jgi:apyrase